MHSKLTFSKIRSLLRIDLIHDNRRLCSRVKSNATWFLRGQTSDKICQLKKLRSSLFILDKGNRITFYVEDAIGELPVEVIIVTFLEAVASETVLTACNNDVKLSETRTVHDYLI